MHLKNHRKQYIKEYQQLFIALLKIPDKDVQKRVVNAINGKTDSCDCGNKQKNKNNISTQTEDVVDVMYNNKISSSEVEEKDSSQNSTSEVFLLKDIEKNVLAKRKRKRIHKIPVVLKKTREENSQQLVLKQETKLKINTECKNVKMNERENSIDSDIFEEILKNHHTIIAKPRDELTKFDILKKMKEEYKNCLIFDNGFLPIHQYLRSNDLYGLQRQLYVIKNRNIKLDNLVTEKEESIMQIAIQSNCSTEIFNELITSENVDLTEVDDQENNLMHLAVEFFNNDNDSNVRSFELLVGAMDLDSMSQLNDKGSTPLHCAVRSNQFKFVHIILNTINKKINLKHVITDDLKTKEDYLRCYKNLLNTSSSIKEKALMANVKKMRILNFMDLMHGRTALYFAIDMRAELLTYMLLVNLANPNIADYSGIDVQTYFGDFSSYGATNNFICAKLLDVSIFYKEYYTKKKTNTIL